MGWWDKPAIVVANRQKLPLVGRDKYTHSQHYGRSSMAVAQVWHYRGMRGEMTGTALTGRLGIIPTLGHIINSYISE